MSRVILTRAPFSTTANEKKVFRFTISFGRNLDVPTLMQQNSFGDIFKVERTDVQSVSQQRILQKERRLERMRRRHLRKFGVLNHFRTHFEDTRLLQETSTIRVTYRAAGSDSVTMEVAFPTGTISARVRISVQKTLLVYNGKVQPIAKKEQNEQISFVSSAPNLPSLQKVKSPNPSPTLLKEPKT